MSSETQTVSLDQPVDTSAAYEAVSKKNSGNELQHNLFVLRSLVSKDFKLKYRRSVLGIVWSLLNPLLMMIVMAAVFSYMFRFQIEHFPVYLILVYLLTKTVIDRSSRYISYMKVFGYRSREVDGLYIRPITYAVAFSLVASIPLIIVTLTFLLRMMFMSFSGNFPIEIPNDRLALVVAFGMACYAVVAITHVRRIHKVPLSLALKVQE